MDESPVRADLVAWLRDPSGLDSIDGCRLRLVTLRTRIDSHWPEPGRRARRGKTLTTQDRARMTELLAALPSPLPPSAGASPEEIFPHEEMDLPVVCGRAVDAGLALLAAGSLEALYPGQVRLFAGRADGAAEPIVVPQPTAGLPIATIVGTLEAVSECPRRGAQGNSAKRGVKCRSVSCTGPASRR